jgi:uncharacterized membrane protein YcaP (DUF421 family)
MTKPDIKGLKHEDILSNAIINAKDKMMNFVFMLLIIGAVYSLIAYLTSRARKE